jgi:ABC-type uncharacterized transport system involved in gliding motility auxiliary subunit
MNNNLNPLNQDPRNPKASNDKSVAILWIAAFVLGVGLIFARFVYPELVWATIVIAVGLVASLGLLIQKNMSALKGRTAAFGLNSLVTVLLVIGIVGVLNFLGHAHPAKLDLTKNKAHTLSDQTDKLIKGLNKPVKVVLYAKLQQKEQLRPLLEDYRRLNASKFEIEYVDPDKEPTRAKQAGIKKYGTLQILMGTRDNKIEDVTEEKLTNAIIKINQDKTPVLCSLTGHGEKSLSGTDAEGYDVVKKGLQAQSFETKEVNLVQEGKIPADCDAIAILGPTKPYFGPEIKLISAYLDNGGRALVALDVNLKGGEYAPELLPVLASWNVKPLPMMVVDPLSRMLNVDASIAIIATFAKDNPITRDMQGNCFFPLMRPIDIVKTDPSLKAEWIAQTTPKSWAVADLKTIVSGQVAFHEGKDRTGPLNGAVAVSGKRKDSKAARDTRIVVLGSSAIGSNTFQRLGNNLDFFLNAVSWVMENENLISIRAKDQQPGKVELSQKEATTIGILTVFLIPLLIAVGGIVIWALRRRL